MLPGLNDRQNYTHNKQKMTVEKLRLRMTNAEDHWQQCANGPDDQHLHRPPQ
jgi:hypothetical protein